MELKINPCPKGELICYNRRLINAGDWKGRLSKALVILLLLTSMALGRGSTEIDVRQDPGGIHNYSGKPAPNSKRLLIRPGLSYHVVQSVYDGDTLLLYNGNKVRLSGINTPEVESSRNSGESGGEKARSWLKNAIEGKKIYLEEDVQGADRYQRILAHVFTEDGAHINRILVRLGLAAVTIYPPNLKYAQALLDAQDLAENKRLGIWGDPVYTPRPLTSLPGSNGRGWRRFIGRALAVKPGRKFYRLHFSDQVDVRIPRANLDLFPDLKSYLGRELEIRGWPSRRNNHYSILVNHPSALRMSTEQSISRVLAIEDNVSR